MKDERAKQLIERYFAGQTDLQEEQQLKAYFATGKVAESLKPYAPLFAYWGEQAEVTAPPIPVRHRRLPRILLAVAAALLLLLVADLIYDRSQPAISSFPVAERQPVDWSQYEITDEEEALRFVRTVLSNTSEHMQSAPAITVRELREVERIID